MYKSDCLVRVLSLFPLLLLLIASESPDAMVTGGVTTTFPPIGEDFNELPAYPPQPPMDLKEVCQLQTADYYVGWWSNRNGTILTDSVPAGFYIVDLSNAPRNDSQLAAHIESNVSRNRSHTIISLANANLTVVPKKSLQLLAETVEVLSLRGNQFSDVQWAAFPPEMTVLRELDLSSCGITVLNSGTFDGMPELQRLFLAHNRIDTLAEDVFRPFRNLLHLDLAYNSANKFNRYIKLNVVLKQTFEPPRNALDVFDEGLLIHADTFGDLDQLLLLDVSFSKLMPASVQAFAELPRRLQMLSLCYTDLPLLPKQIFNGTELQVLDLSGNSKLANTMSFDALYGLADTLETLAIDDANLKTLSFFCRLSHLRLLSLSGNNINALYSNAFMGLHSLETLDLSRNHLGNWYAPVFNVHSPLLRTLLLHDNNINMITPAMFRDFEQLRLLALGNNNFVCSCSMRDFIDVAIANSALAGNDSRWLEESAPAAAIGHMYISDKPGSSELIRAQLRATYDVRLLTYRLHQKHLARSLRLLQHVRQRLARYNVLMLVNNRTRFHRGPLRSMYVAAELMNFTFHLIDFHHHRYRCINSTTNEVFKLEDIASCMTHNLDHQYQSALPSAGAIVAIVMGSVLALCAVYLVVYLNRWRLQSVWTSLRNSWVLASMRRDSQSRLIGNKRAAKDDVAGMEEESERAGVVDSPSMVYDVFVSYCERNRDWILNEFLPNMEQCSDIHVCLHERDFQVGMSILENIIQCMDQSRCLLLVVSESFLHSQWCQFEMHLAQHRLLETRCEQLILILLEDIPKHKRPQTLHYLMSTKTYIKWPAEADVSHTTKSVRSERQLFWRRLKRALVAQDWEYNR